jgi:hypothetical protein
MLLYDDFPDDRHKINNIWTVSNPREVRRRYHDLYKDEIKRIKLVYGADSEIYPSSQKWKKYMVFNGEKMIHFGDIRYYDFTYTNDERQRQRYRQRFNKPDDDPYSPYNLSLNLLW